MIKLLQLDDIAKLRTIVYENLNGKDSFFSFSPIPLQINGRLIIATEDENEEIPLYVQLKVNKVPTGGVSY